MLRYIYIYLISGQKDIVIGSPGIRVAGDMKNVDDETIQKVLDESWLMLKWATFAQNDDDDDDDGDDDDDDDGDCDDDDDDDDDDDCDDDDDDDGDADGHDVDDGVVVVVDDDDDDDSSQPDHDHAPRTDRLQRNIVPWGLQGHCKRGLGSCLRFLGRWGPKVMVDRKLQNWDLSIVIS